MKHGNKCSALNGKQTVQFLLYHGDLRIKLAIQFLQVKILVILLNVGNCNNLLELCGLNDMLCGNTLCKWLFALHLDSSKTIVKTLGL